MTRIDAQGVFRTEPEHEGATCSLIWNLARSSLIPWAVIGATVTDTRRVSTLCWAERTGCGLRAFAIVGAAGLVRYRARIDDPKDAGVMLVALAVGLTTGSGLFQFAAASTVFVIVVLWILESLEPEARSRFDLKIVTKNAPRLRPGIEHALGDKGITYELRASSTDELRYEVTVPFKQKINKLSKLIRSLDGHDGTSVEWEIKKYETLQA